MRKEENFYFGVSLSVDAYSNKEAVNAALAAGEVGRNLRETLGIKNKIAFINKMLTSGELLEAALRGYTFCTPHSCFPNNGNGKTYVRRDGAYTMSGKADIFFCGSSFVGVDIDKTKYASASDFVAHLEHKPTLWYSSFSNKQIDESGKSRGARFRMVYVFRQPFRGKYYFRYCAHKLYNAIEADTGEVIDDKCGMLPSQYFNGTCRNNNLLHVEFGLTNFIYSSDDFGITDVDYLRYLSNYCGYQSIQKHKDNIEKEYRSLFPLCNTNLPENPFAIYKNESVNLTEVGEAVRVSKELFNDAGRLGWEEFYALYKDKYPYVYRVEHPEAWQTISIEGIGVVKYQDCGEDYFELRWPTRRTKDGTMPRLTDGCHRRNTLFHRAWLRRIIMPDITPDIMFYNLMVDRYRFFDNRDGVLTVETLLNKVKQAFSQDVEYLKKKYSNVYNDTLVHSKKKKRIIHWMSSKVNASTLNKELLWRFLDTVYDKNSSVSENLAVLNDSDISISRSTIYRYRKERGGREETNKYERFKLLHKEGLSLRKELEALKAGGLTISIRTLLIYRKRLEEDANGLQKS